MSSENKKGAIGHNNDAQREQASNPILGANGTDRNLIPDNGETCDCAEAQYKNKAGEIVPTLVGAHSCIYVARRNAFIPRAQAFADSMAPDGGRHWSRLFSRQMTKLMGQNWTSSGGAL